MAKLRLSLLPLIGTRLAIAAAAAVLLAVIWGAALHLIRVDQETARKAAIESTLELAGTYEAQMAASLASIDQTLRTVKYAYELRGHHQALHELRDKGLLPPAFIFKVSIANASGTVVASTAPELVGTAAPETGFPLHRSLERDGAVVSPQPGKDGFPEIFFSRRLDTPDGRFAGAALLSVEPDYFTSAYERSRLGEHGMLALISADGSFIARRPDQVIWQADRGAQPKLPLDRLQLGVQLLELDGVSRFVHSKPLFGYPMSVMVGLAEAEQLAASERRRRDYLLEAGVASALLIPILLILARLSEQLSAARSRSRRDQETYYAATNASLDAFFILHCVRDRQGRIVDFVAADTNKRGAELFGVGREDIIGKTLCGTFPDIRNGTVFEDFVRVAETGVPSEADWRNRLPKLKAEWIYRQILRVEGGVVVIVRDISERKRSELLRSEQGRVLEKVAKGVPLEEVQADLMRLLEAQFDHTFCSILLAEKDGLHLRHGATVSLPLAFVKAIESVPVAEMAGSCGTAAFRREPVVVSDIETDPLWTDYRDVALEHGLRACWSVPILSQRDTVLGTFAVYATAPCSPSVEHMQLIDTAARIAGIAIERKQSEDQIRYMAHHDALTGLPNRSLLEDRVDQALMYAHRYGRQVTVVFIDLDNFKLINDSLGHNAGDALLCVVAERMVGCVRNTDTVVRLGGDEFVIVLVDQAPDADSVTATLERLRAAIAAPVEIAGQNLRVSASIGLATYPADGADPNTLLMNADAAMYRAKELGRNNYQFYTAEMNSRVHRKLEMQEGLRLAIARQEFFLLYQPQVDMSTGRIFGVEVLVRWKHPERGVVPPNDFIPLAEETGLIVPIGEWVLREACRQNKAWQDAGMAPVVVAVNVSARQFKDKELVRKVRNVLQETGLEANYLELELTESLIMQDLQQAIEIMQELQAMGVQLSIDDFGTGYSSLSALKSFPIARLKLDRSFVRDLPSQKDDSAIALAVISLGHKLNLRVLAEGVETAEQLAFLRENDCDEMQGFYFSRPVPAQEVVALLAAPACVPGQMRA